MKKSAIAVVLMTFLQGCSIPSASDSKDFRFNLAGFRKAKVLPYDSPPQIIYRIDDHRFITLERYRDCNHGDAYYNDTQQGIRASLGRGGIENFQGRLIIADPTGKNLAFPKSAPPHTATRDRGVEVALTYSTDGGRTFGNIFYIPHSSNPFDDSKDYLIVTTEDYFFIVKEYKYRTDRPDYDLSVRKYVIDNSTSSLNLVDSAWASKKRLIPKGLRSPSDQDRITCDPSIKPTNPDAPLVP